jgi:hypothetical protein
LFANRISKGVIAASSVSFLGFRVLIKPKMIQIKNNTHSPDKIGFVFLFDIYVPHSVWSNREGYCQEIRSLGAWSDDAVHCRVAI